MRLDVLFGEEEGVLQTTTLQTATLTSGSVRRYEDKLAQIHLVYEKDDDLVPATKKDMAVPDTLSGIDYVQGVHINNDGCATFKIKILALSSQHENKLFRFRVTIFLDNKTETLYSVPFRTLSKLNRKRKCDDSLCNASLSANDPILQETLEEMLDDSVFPTMDGWEQLCDIWRELKEKTAQLLILQTDIARLTARMGSHMSKMSLLRMHADSSTEIESIASSSKEDDNMNT